MGRGMPPGGERGACRARGSPAAERVRTSGGQRWRLQVGRLRTDAARRPRGISCGQRRRPREAALPGIRRLLYDFEALRRAAPAPGSPCPSGLSPPPGAGPRTRAPAEYGGPLLARPPPEKGADASAPHRKAFRRHGKKSAAALNALSKERRPLGAGVFGPKMHSPRIFDAYLPGATHPAWTLLPRVYIGPAAAAPAVPRRPLAKTPAWVPRGLGRPAAEREAP